MKLTHAVVVSTGNVNGAVSLGSLPSSAVSVSVPYSVDTAFASANQQTSWLACDTNYLIEGPADLYVTAIYGESSTTNPGAIADAFKSVVSIVTSLAPVVTGAALGPNAAKTLSGVEGALSPLESLFKDLFPSSGANYQITTKLRIGSTSVATQFSTVSVTVRPIDSIVFDDKNPDNPYFKDFAKLIDGLKITGSLDENACQGVQRSLSQAGFRSADDQAYALGRLAIGKNLGSRASAAECLGDLCQTAIADKMDGVLWNESRDLKPRSEDCEGVRKPDVTFVAQPPWATVGPIVKDLAILYGQYNVGAPLPTTFSQFIGANLSNRIDVDDKTSYRLFGTAAAIDPQGLFDTLKGKTFLRLGCWAGVDNPTMFYGSRSSIVSAKIPKVGASAPITDAIAVFPFWSAGKIAKIVVSDDSQDISTTIGKLTSCGGFTVTTK